MKNLFLSLPIAGLLLVSCSKNDDNSNVTPVATSVEARYEMNLSSSDYQTDSIVGMYLQKDGTMASVKSTTGSWASPAMTYKSGDSVYARVVVYGKKLSVAALTPNVYLIKTADKTLVKGTSSQSSGSGSSTSYTGTSTASGKVVL